MSRAFGLAESVRLALDAETGGRDVVLAVVVSAPSEPALVGRRLAWDGERLLGTLGDEAATAAAGRLLESLAAGDEPACARIPGSDVELYVEAIGGPPELVIVGAGHIAQPLSSVGRLLGLRVTVVDDRPEFARTERFPDADRVVVVDFADPFAVVRITPRSRIVMVTRGHRYDYDCVRALARMRAEPAYLGMIGSKRRVRAAFEQLAAEGFDREWLARIRAPVGLDIEAETPAEIAVAIAAEMVLAARGGTGAPMRDRADVLRHVKALASAGVGGGAA